MDHAPTFVGDLAVVLMVAAFTSVGFRLLRQSTIVGYLLAGLIVGPYIPIPLFADAGRVHALSEFGVVLVMFSVGLEFSFRRLLQLLPVSGLTALVQIGAMLWLGLTIGPLMGWTDVESLFLGGAVAISSTMVVANVFAERPPSVQVRELVFGVLVIQDIAAIVLIAALTAVATGTSLSPLALAETLGRLVIALTVMISVGLLVVPRAIRAVDKMGSAEPLLVTSIGICFALALLAAKLGYSVALGGFLAGTLIGESGRAQKVEHLVHPLRDLFAAVFFVSVGMTVDPRLALAYAPEAFAVAALVVAGQVISVSVAGVLAGNGFRVAIESGLSLGQIGEFAFIMAGIGAGAGVLGEAFQPVLVSVAVITAFTTPLLVGVSGKLALAIDHRLPASVRTFLSLYASWLEQLRSGAGKGRGESQLRRRVTEVAFDAFVATALMIATATWAEKLTAAIADATGASPFASTALLVALTALLMAPLLRGIIRCARDIGVLMASRVLPSPGEGQLDLGAAPRRIMTLTFQLLVVLAVLSPMAAITAPFVPGYGGLAVVLVVVVFATYFVRSAGDLRGHVAAASEAIVEGLGVQSASEDAPLLLPGLEHVRRLLVAPDAFAVGRTLRELDVRASTGASILAIRREGGSVFSPGAADRVCAGDTLAAAGSTHAIELARALLSLGPAALVAADSETPEQRDLDQF